MNNLLLGKEIRDRYDPILNEKVSALLNRGTSPTLATLRVGSKPDDMAYEQSLTRSAGKFGIAVSRNMLPENAEQDDVLKTIRTLNEDASVHGILLFRPLPAHIDEDAVRNEVAPGKDVDGITDMSSAALYGLHRAPASGITLPSGFIPCTAEAVIRLLDHYEIPVAGRRATVIGRSGVIGKPVSLLLLAKDATVTICHSRTADMEKTLKNSDIIVAAAGLAGNGDGKAGRLDANYFSAGQIVIDVAIHTDDAGNLYGDVDTEQVSPIVDRITPVPGGVGGVTTLCLLEHVVKAAGDR
jgi:methylenetetrahydrofolate dehydrogenase (NADP+)/methenyltetrahydrofolate cyclohydrolase